MVDEFTERYADLVTGSYDCVDRIVLNAYFPLGHSPGGFRVWWRRLHDDSDELLDNNHLMRFAGRFARRVRAWAAANGVPIIDCKAGDRKHEIAERYLAEHPVAGPAVFLVLVAKAPATVWDVRRSEGGVLVNLAKRRPRTRPVPSLPRPCAGRAHHRRPTRLARSRHRSDPGRRPQPAPSTQTIPLDRHRP